jgi:hypothetical protein
VTTALLVVALCSLVDVYRRFGGASCSRHQGDRVCETSASIYHTTRSNIPKNCDLHTRRRRENLKSPSYLCCYVQQVPCFDDISSVCGVLQQLARLHHVALQSCLRGGLHLAFHAPPCSSNVGGGGSHF